MSGAGGSRVDRRALAAWLGDQRWFAGKAQRIVALDVEDEIPLGDAVVTIVDVTLDRGDRQRYAVPLAETAAMGATAAATEPTGAATPATDAVAPPSPSRGLATHPLPADALDGAHYVRALLDLVGRDGRAIGARGEIVGLPTRAFPGTVGGPSVVRRLLGEQSNTSVVVGDLIVKHFRRLAEGRNPEEEMGRFLTERTTFAHAPRLAGHAEYRPRDGEASTLAVVHEVARDTEDGWEWVLGALRAGRPTLPALGRLGTRTAELHLALASKTDDPAFAPEPITSDDIHAWAARVERQLDAARRVLDSRAEIRLPDLAVALGGLAGRAKIRHHGDYHLGQTRHGAGDWVILDFEGEPLRPLSERRARHTPLRDVAGMLRSIDYAAATAWSGADEAAAERWRSDASAAFIDAYRARADGAPFLPPSETVFERAVAVFVVEKAAYEVVYEASHRPDWVAIPRRGLATAAAALSRSQQSAPTPGSIVAPTLSPPAAGAA